MIKRTGFLILVLIPLISGVVYSKGLTISQTSSPFYPQRSEEFYKRLRPYEHLVVEPLVLYLAGEYKPLLATSWRKTSQNTWRIVLKEKVNLHSGKPVTAETVLQSFHVLQASPEFAPFASWVQSLKKVGEREIELTMISDKLSPFSILTRLYLFESNTEAKDVTSDGAKGFNPIIGTGKYLVASHNPKSVKLSRFEGYWNQESKGNIEVIDVSLEEPIKAIPVAKTEIMDWQPMALELAGSRVKKPKGTKIESSYSKRLWILQYSYRKDSPVADLKIRRMIDSLVDQNGLTKEIFGVAAKSPQAVEIPKSEGSNRRVKKRNNAKSVLKMLSKRKQPFSQTLKLGIQKESDPIHRKIAEKLAQSLAQASLKIEIVVLESPKKPLVAPIDLLLTTYDPVSENPAQIYQELLVHRKDSESGLVESMMGYSNPVIVDLLEAAFAPQKLERKLELIYHIASVLEEELPFIPLAWEGQLWLAKTSVKAKGALLPGGRVHYSELIR